MKKISLMILVLMAVLASCKKTPEVNLKYVDVERDLVTVGTTTATIQCDYNYIATLKKAYLFYGEGQDEVNMISAEMRVVQNTLYLELAGLKANTTYSYYYEFYNGFNSMRTALKTFKTESGNGGGVEPPTPEITLPTVITASATEITANSAKGGGEVTNDGGAEVTERGICWSTSTNPTISDSHVATGTGTGAFAATMSGLEANTIYHVRAYAINDMGTAYGMDKEFTTPVAAPEGAINGLFTINENGDKVYFSKGNLQYIGSAATPFWKFADNQWDFFGETTEQNSANQNVDRDLFGWGTSGYDHGANCYQPWSISISNGDYYAYGSSGYNLYEQTGQADWGYNPISNGGNQANQWRTLTQSEWAYVFNSRTTSSGICYACANVNNVNGVILLPDDWSTSYYTLSDTNTGASFSSNIISAIQWSTLEQHGAVFLPAAGDRYGTSVHLTSGGVGVYWSASCNASSHAYAMNISGGGISPHNYNDRCRGFSVRLARVAE